VPAAALRCSSVAVAVARRSPRDHPRSPRDHPCRALRWSC